MVGGKNKVYDNWVRLDGDVVCGEGHRAVLTQRKA